MLEKYAFIKALGAITANPNRSFSVRGLAKEAKLSPAASMTALNQMHYYGIVWLKTGGGMHQFSANLENALCRHWKMIFNLMQLQESKVVSEVVSKIPNVQSVLLYGSFARGTNDEKSDIDLLVITNKTVKMDLGFVNKLKKEVNLSLFSFSDWKKKAMTDKVFYENVIFDSIVLFGERPVVL